MSGLSVSGLYKWLQETMWSQAQRQAEQIQLTAEDRRVKALTVAKAEAWETLSKAEKFASTTMQGAQVKAAGMLQQQEAQMKLATQAQAEASSALDRARKEAASTLQEAQAKADRVAQQAEAQAKQAADAQDRASTVLAKAEKDAAATLQEAQAKAARMAQQQEAQAKQAADAMKEQVSLHICNVNLALIFEVAEAHQVVTYVTTCHGTAKQ